MRCRLSAERGVPELGHRVARDVEADRLLQRVHHAVVKEDVPRRDVPERGRLERAAEGILPGALLLAAYPQRPADAQVDVSRAAVGGDLEVARDADGLVRVVGEHSGAPIVVPRPMEVAARAVALLRIDEDGESPLLGRRERALRLLLDVKVELARIGMKARVLELERLQREGHVVEGSVRVVEDAAAERLDERSRGRGFAERGDDVRAAGVRHFEGRQERHLRLLRQRVGATVPREAAAGRRGGDAVGVVEQVGVSRRELLVANRRDRP